MLLKWNKCQTLSAKKKKDVLVTFGFHSFDKKSPVIQAVVFLSIMHHYYLLNGYFQDFL